MSLEHVLKGYSVAISVSESPDLQEFGLGPEHVDEAAVILASQVIAMGAVVVYGGDLRPSGFTRTLIDLAYRYRTNKDLTRKVAVFENVLAWPVHVSTPTDTLQETISLDERVVRVILLDKYGRVLEQIQVAGRAMTEPSKADWDQGLTAMRRFTTEHAFARVVLGGRVEGYKGRLPGIGEEALTSLSARKPLFVLGGFGGCARDICEDLNLVPPGEKRRDWPLRGEIAAFGAESLNNSLSQDENIALAVTPQIDEAVVLIMRGLLRLARSG